MPKQRDFTRRDDIVSDLRMEITKRRFRDAIIIAIISGVFSSLAAFITILPNLPSQRQDFIYHVAVAADKNPFENTNVTIEKGDLVKIIVLGDDANWNCGKGPVGPSGYINEKWSSFVMPSANLCELVGYIREGIPFRIGAYTEFEAEDSGFLYLGANDAENLIGDNSGQLSIRIVIRR
ncbi:MAG: hypothetical protein D6694_12550 [Gammaproteobacteria bacterium]|nr:MAG: hypothetical protein D6694_12550 [Gammaproteobacteria bacterium]